MSLINEEIVGRDCCFVDFAEKVLKLLIVMNVCIYGGGNVAHAIAGVISLVQPVSVVTRHPKEWADKLTLEQGPSILCSKFSCRATSDVAVVREADVIIIALPQYVQEVAINCLKDNLKPGATVAFIPAPARIHEYSIVLKSRGARVVGFQRVPFVSRIKRYGYSAQISLARKVNILAVSDAFLKSEWEALCFRWFGSCVDFLSSFFALSFSNSNPLLHPSRLVVLFDDWRSKIFKYNPYFYREWTDASSELYVEADREMKDVMLRYKDIDVSTDYTSVFKHYEVSSVQGLTKKIRSIIGLRNIKSPMCEVDGAWVPDFKSRYFTEDVPYGTCEIQRLAKTVGVQVPIIDELICRMERIVNSL